MSPPEPGPGSPIEGGPLVAVGRIGKAHGLRGEVSVEAWTDDPEDRFAPGSVLTTAPASGPAAPASRGLAPASGLVAPVPGTSLTVEAARRHAGRWLLTFTGVGDRSAAESLRGTRLLLPARARPPIEDPDEYYDSDLIGLRAEAPDGAFLGTVTDVVHGPVGDYLAVVLGPGGPAPAAPDGVPRDEAVPPVASPIRGADGGREHLVPFVSRIVPVVEPAAGRVVIDAPHGLFDL